MKNWKKKSWEKISFKTNTELPNKKKFTLYENIGSWTNNYGNYGTFFCYGSIQSLTNSYEGLLVICEHLDSDNEKYWILYERSNEGEEGGIRRRRKKKEKKKEKKEKKKKKKEEGEEEGQGEGGAEGEKRRKKKKDKEEEEKKEG